MASLWQTLRKGRLRRAQAEAWQTAILHVARDPAPFGRGWVADTLEGRAQMVALITVLVIRRFRRIDHTTKLVADIYHGIFSSFDHAMRETGVGDASIARKMRKLGEEFVGLARAYDRALDSTEDTEVNTILERNGVVSRDNSSALAVWLDAVRARLNGFEDEMMRTAATAAAFASPR